jgi:hypothetical protein
MFLAFSRILDAWIGVAGVAYSAQTAAIFQLLRDYYHSAPKAAFILCGVKSSDAIPDDQPLAPQAETVPIRGWKALTNIRTTSALYGPPRLSGGEVVYIDFIPAVLERALGQSSRALKQALATLRDLKLLITEESDGLRTQRRVEGRNTTVIRIKGEFFADDQSRAP